jgi:TRAP transporter TAXI family solute receptor
MKKFRLITVWSIIALMLVSGASLAFAKDAQSYNFTIGTSSLGSTMYIMGVPWSQVITKSVPNATASVQSTAGASANIQLIEAQEVQLAFASNAAAYDGWHGIGWSRGREYRRMRMLFPIYSAYWQMITLNPKIRKTQDIVGYSVSVGGQPGATSDIFIRDCMSVMDFEPGSIQYITTSNGVNYLKDGQIDAVAFVMAIPTSYVMDLETSHEVRLVGMDRKEVEMICEAKPYYTPAIIPAGTYKHEPEDVDTALLWTFGVADKDIPDEVAYNIVKSVYENLDVFATAHSAGRNMNPKDVINAAIPLHPGAIRYYQEIGIDLPERLTQQD